MSSIYTLKHNGLSCFFQCHLLICMAPGFFLAQRLEEMKRQEMPKMLRNRAEIYLFVNKEKLTMQLGNERAGEIRSLVLTKAICENYLGPKPVSPALKRAVMAEMQSIKDANNKSMN